MADTGAPTEAKFDGLRVAVVDDDELMRDLLCRALDQLGITVVGTAIDGAAALELLARTEVDVLICDLNMPGMDGIELLRHLAAIHEAPALAMISGDDHILRIAAELGRAHRLRVLGTIPKPATPTVLSQVLERVWLPSDPGAEPGSPGVELDDDLVAMVPDALELHYQPQLSLTTGQPTAVEALARLRHPRLGLLGPGLFVPLCEHRGLSGQLLRGVLRLALHQVVIWRESGLPIRVAVNVSCDDLEVTLVEDLVRIANNASVPLDAITLELTESRILPDTTGPIEVLTRLRMKGVQLSIDDYGTGFSSLQQLRRIPFHELKIDQTFVSNATTDRGAQTMLSSTVQLARELNLSTVAEGVETAEQLALVTELGCDMAQGFFLARPMPVDDVSAWLKERYSRGGASGT